MFCIPQQNDSSYQIKNNEIGEACGVYGIQESCIQGFDGET